jgi:hypothetical protein
MKLLYILAIIITFYVLINVQDIEGFTRPVDVNELYNSQGSRLNSTGSPVDVNQLYNSQGSRLNSTGSPVDVNQLYNSQGSRLNSTGSPVDVNQLYNSQGSRLNSSETRSVLDNSNTSNNTSATTATNIGPIIQTGVTQTLEPPPDIPNSNTSSIIALGIVTMIGASIYVITKK